MAIISIRGSNCSLDWELSSYLGVAHVLGLPTEFQGPYYLHPDSLKDRINNFKVYSKKAPGEFQGLNMPLVETQLKSLLVLADFARKKKEPVLISES